jgi:hypothetical protein
MPLPGREGRDNTAWWKDTFWSMHEKNISADGVIRQVEG